MKALWPQMRVILQVSKRTTQTLDQSSKQRKPRYESQHMIFISTNTSFHFILVYFYQFNSRVSYTRKHITEHSITRTGFRQKGGRDFRPLRTTPVPPLWYCSIFCRHLHKRGKQGIFQENWIDSYFHTPSFFFSEWMWAREPLGKRGVFFIEAHFWTTSRPDSCEERRASSSEGKKRVFHL